jgi:hypothetical protein
MAGFGADGIVNGRTRWIPHIPGFVRDDLFQSLVFGVEKSRVWFFQTRRKTTVVIEYGETNTRNGKSIDVAH